MCTSHLSTNRAQTRSPRTWRKPDCVSRSFSTRIEFLRSSPAISNRFTPRSEQSDQPTSRRVTCSANGVPGLGSWRLLRQVSVSNRTALKLKHRWLNTLGSSRRTFHTRWIRLWQFCSERSRRDRRTFCAIGRLLVEDRGGRWLRRFGNGPRRHRRCLRLPVARRRRGDNQPVRPLRCKRRFVADVLIPRRRERLSEMLSVAVPPSEP